jgi:hypothetical protein
LALGVIHSKGYHIRAAFQVICSEWLKQHGDIQWYPWCRFTPLFISCCRILTKQSSGTLRYTPQSPSSRDRNVAMTLGGDSITGQPEEAWFPGKSRLRLFGRWGAQTARAFLLLFYLLLPLCFIVGNVFNSPSCLEESFAAHIILVYSFLFQDFTSFLCFFALYNFFCKISY